MTTKLSFILLFAGFYAVASPLIPENPISFANDISDEDFKSSCNGYITNSVMDDFQKENFCSEMSYQRRRLKHEPDSTYWKPHNRLTFNLSYRGQISGKYYEAKIFRTNEHKKLIGYIKKLTDDYQSKDKQGLISDLNKAGIYFLFPVLTYTLDYPEQSVAISSGDVPGTYADDIKGSLHYSDVDVLINIQRNFFTNIGEMVAILDKHVGANSPGERFDIPNFISSQHALFQARKRYPDLYIPIAELESGKNSSYRNFKTFVWFIGYENYKVVERINSNNRFDKKDWVENQKVANFAIESFKVIRDAYFEYVRKNTDENGYFHGTEKKPLMAEVDFDDLLEVLQSKAHHEGIYNVIKTNRDVGFDPGKMNLDKLKNKHTEL
ncbi:hypothetical protein NX722_16105 [Endozoicomonas gorgoniicola]|uniref:Uncharacterized protein n=1 Tax=Endozoicomonas gorgoniicola TaxID=1234144 RepID=A0ABT3MYN8_9GAMM|nr:hypothetical protein [Endozoicomonas gorgoniicola]MCW7554114.1 hypothetical protein [Endozoicomonas gorgoniicola]